MGTARITPTMPLSAIPTFMKSSRRVRSVATVMEFLLSIWGNRYRAGPGIAIAERQAKPRRPTHPRQIVVFRGFPPASPERQALDVRRLRLFEALDRLAKRETIHRQWSWRFVRHAPRCHDTTGNSWHIPPHHAS